MINVLHSIIQIETDAKRREAKNWLCKKYSYEKKEEFIKKHSVTGLEETFGKGIVQLFLLTIVKKDILLDRYCEFLYSLLGDIN